VIELVGSRDESDSSVLHGLKAVDVTTRQPGKHGVTVVESRENKAGD
jgi:hypothetical protein